MSSFDMRTELLLDRAIKQRLNELVCRATKTACLLNGTQMEESQLRNLLHTASESRSLEVVANFIRYQIARNGRAWDTRREGFGHTVIADLETPITEMARQTAEEVDKELRDPPNKEVSSQGEAAGNPAQPVDRMALQESAFAQMMLLYLGYLNRAFYFAKKMSDFAALDTVVKRWEKDPGAASQKQGQAQ